MPTDDLLEQFKINAAYGEHIPLSRQAAIRTFAEEFVHSRDILSERKSQYVYQSVLANVCFQSALVRADLSRLLILSDLIVFVRDAITTYLNQQNALNAGMPLQAFQKPDDTLLVLFEYVMALVFQVKIAEEVAAETAMFLLQQEEGNTEELGKLEETAALFNSFSVYMVPAAIAYMEEFYPSRLEQYLDSY
jgi:hypothetical protein